MAYIETLGKEPMIDLTVINLEQPLAHQIPEQIDGRFHFSDPHWLRVGQYVELNWVRTTHVKDTEIVTANLEGKMFNFDRALLRPVTELKTVCGTITDAFPARKKAQELREQGLQPRIRFTPERSKAVIPGTMTIYEADFEKFIFVGLPRAMRWDND
ncbi:MAG: hypothetical protein JWO41_535 [Candidatus Saccharibacteria bacterium]|nr:hypothetical protein [Candidatus Saccharibacteria bacterium]